MKLGIMQPYFFPYVGHFELIAQTDRWVVFDVVKYNRKSWMNRNRVLHPTQGWQYINAPVQHSAPGSAIHEIRLTDKDKTLQRVLGQLDHYRRHAPHYKAVVNLIREGFARCRTDRLVDLNVSTLCATCDYLGLNINWQLCSETVPGLTGIEHAGQWALRISQSLGAQEYINPPGGIDLFRPEEWTSAGIRLSVASLSDVTYDCAPYKFQHHLSILDTLMWMTPESVRAEWSRPASQRLESAWVESALTDDTMPRKVPDSVDRLSAVDTRADLSLLAGA
jgi:WbqC-like protein family